jgi:hypothetical protein
MAPPPRANASGAMTELGGSSGSASGRMTELAPGSGSASGAMTELAGLAGASRAIIEPSRGALAASFGGETVRCTEPGARSRPRAAGRASRVARDRARPWPRRGIPGEDAASVEDVDRAAGQGCVVVLGCRPRPAPRCLVETLDREGIARERHAGAEAVEGARCWTPRGLSTCARSPGNPPNSLADVGT